MLSKLNTKDGWVVTAGGVDYIKGTNGTLHTCIEFDYSYPYLTCNNFGSGYYVNQLVTDKASEFDHSSQKWCEGCGRYERSVLYDEKRGFSELRSHACNVQWAVEYTGCEEDPVARVKVTVKP